MKKYVFFKVFRKMTNPKNRINTGENGILKKIFWKVLTSRKTYVIVTLSARTRGADKMTKGVKNRDEYWLFRSLCRSMKNCGLWFDKGIHHFICEMHKAWDVLKKMCVSISLIDKWITILSNVHVTGVPFWKYRGAKDFRGIKL